MSSSLRHAREAAPDTARHGPSFARLDELLWRERGLLECLAYRLAAQRAVVAGGEVRWLRASDREVTSAVRELRRHEVLRAVEADQVIRQLDRPVDATLADLAGAAPSPWSFILDEHRSAMRRLESQISTCAAETVAMLVDVDRATTLPLGTGS